MLVLRGSMLCVLPIIVFMNLRTYVYERRGTLTITKACPAGQPGSNQCNCKESVCCVCELNALPMYSVLLW